MDGAKRSPGGVRTGRAGPNQLPLKGVSPLLELPLLPFPPLAEHLVPPKALRRFASGRGEVGKNAEGSEAFWTERSGARRVRRPGGAAESIFEPLQDEEESGSFPFGQAAEGGEILPPTPAGFLLGFGRAHDVQENNIALLRQTEFVLTNRFLQVRPFGWGRATWTRARIPGLGKGIREGTFGPEARGSETRYRHHFREIPCQDGEFPALSGSASQTDIPSGSHENKHCSVWRLRSVWIDVGWFDCRQDSDSACSGPQRDFRARADDWFPPGVTAIRESGRLESGGS